MGRNSGSEEPHSHLTQAFLPLLLVIFFVLIIFLVHLVLSSPFSSSSFSSFFLSLLVPAILFILFCRPCPFLLLHILCILFTIGFLIPSSSLSLSFSSSSFISPSLLFLFLLLLLFLFFLLFDFLFSFSVSFLSLPPPCPPFLPLLLCPFFLLPLLFLLFQVHSLKASHSQHIAFSCWRPHNLGPACLTLEHFPHPQVDTPASPTCARHTPFGAFLSSPAGIANSELLIGQCTWLLHLNYHFTKAGIGSSQLFFML